MPPLIPASLTYSFYALVAWGLSALFVAFRVLSADDLKKGLALRVFVVAWMGVPAVLAVRGAFLDFSLTPPMLLRVVFPMFLLCVGFSFSPWGKRAAEKIPETLLVGTQVFRLPLELILYALGTRALLPVEMTFSGYNFDLLTGLLALPLWIALHRRRAPRFLLWAWNVLGLTLLVTIIAVAVLSFPAPFGWFQPPNLLVAFYPWIWLPTFLVPVALVSHLLLFRKLTLKTPL